MSKREMKEKCDNCGKSLSGRWKAWHSTGMLADRQFEYCSYKCKVQHAKKMMGYS